MTPRKLVTISVVSVMVVGGAIMMSISDNKTVTATTETTKPEPVRIVDNVFETSELYRPADVDDSIISAGDGTVSADTVVLFSSDVASTQACDPRVVETCLPPKNSPHWILPPKSITPVFPQDAAGDKNPCYSYFRTSVDMYRAVKDYAFTKKVTMASVQADQKLLDQIHADAHKKIVAFLKTQTHATVSTEWTTKTVNTRIQMNDGTWNLHAPVRCVDPKDSSSYHHVASFTYFPSKSNEGIRWTDAGTIVVKVGPTQ